MNISNDRREHKNIPPVIVVLFVVTAVAHHGSVGIGLTTWDNLVSSEYIDVLQREYPVEPIAVID